MEMSHTHTFEPVNAIQKSLSASTKAWFVIAVLGQLIFAYYIFAFFGGSSINGNTQAINDSLMHGFMERDLLGNIALAVHLILAFYITVAGPFQIIPYFRKRFPKMHRLNGRFYIITAFLISAAGLIMIYTRGVVGSIFTGIGNNINAICIMTFAYLAFKKAKERDFIAHNLFVWRMYLSVCGVWFYRLGFSFWIVINGGKAPGSNSSLTGPFDIFMGFAHALLPLMIFELYLWIKRSNISWLKISMTALMGIFIICTAAAIYAATLVFWLPHL